MRANAHKVRRSAYRDTRIAERINTHQYLFPVIVGVAVLSRGVLAFIWVFASVLVLYWIAKLEESDLERIFGERYLLYKSSVPMFFPRLWNAKDKLA
jgi:protein-S-isoprenylcysteine O-methyltransferase Ste14